MKKLLTLSLTALAVISASASVYAQSEEDKKEKELQTIYITAPSKFEEDNKTAATSVTVITAEDIEASGQTSITELLRMTPSVGVSNAGGAGKQSALRIRGEEGYRTAVYIDGVKAIDPTSVQVDPRFEHINLSSIERIEILRGVQGFVYGADAGGVVNIITRQGVGDLSGAFTQSRGSFNSVGTGLDLSAGNEKGDFYVSSNNFKTDGFNARPSDLEKDDDGYENSNFHAKIGWNLDNNLRLQFVSNRTVSDSEYDNCSGSNECNTEFTRSTNQLSISHKGRQLQHSVAIGKTDINVDNLIDKDIDSYGDGEVKNIEYRGAIDKRSFKFLFGTDVEKQFSFYDGFNDVDDSYSNIGQYIEYKDRRINNFFLDIGLRNDRNSQYGSHTSSRLSAAYLMVSNVGEFKVRTSVGNGFRAPSLYEKSYTVSGVILTEETTKGYDFGIDWFGNGGSSASITYFDQSITDEIDYVGSGYTQIKGKSKSSGVELSAKVLLSYEWELSTNYTYNNAKESNGEQRLRRPRHLANLGVKYTKDKFSGSFSARGVKDSTDAIFLPPSYSATPIKLDNYVVVNLGFNYQLNNSVHFFTIVNNLFDKEYQEVNGYNTADRNFNLGTKISF